jgi:signal recognition particle receptor subunit beta
MVLINKAINEVTVKLVYYGPGLCGKTTNLEKIYANPKLDNKGKMISMSTETDRTLFFDFMPMELGTIAGQKVRVQLYTVPGQVFYDATRKLVLRGADGVVFVADSQAEMRDSNLDSLENLRTNLRLNRIDPDKVALVYQLNKRDLPNVASVEEMTSYLGATPSSVVEASAKSGVGVTATLRNAVSKILDNLKNNVDTTLYDEPALSAPDMKQKSGVAQHSAGTPKLSMRGIPAVAAPVAEVVPDEDPFDSDGVAVQVEQDEDPFAHVAEAVADTDAHVDFEDPFATPAATFDGVSGEDELLANASALVASLEAALERARENERKLRARFAD